MDETMIARLSRHPFFSGLTTEALDEISPSAHDVGFQPGHLILAEGASAGTLYLLKRGRVALSAHAPGKGHLLIETLGPGEVLGLSWMFPPFRWQFDARAVDAVEAFALDGGWIRERMQVDAALRYELLARVVPVVLSRLQHTRLRMLDLYSEIPNGNGHSVH